MCWCLMVGLKEEGYTIHVVEDCEEGAQGGATAGLVAAEITRDGAGGYMAPMFP